MERPYFLKFIPLLSSGPPKHTGSFAQNSFQIDSINSCMTSKKLRFWLTILTNIYFLLLKPIKRKLGFTLEIMKKFARWRHKSEISKRTVKTMISPLLLRLWGCLRCQKNQYDPLICILWIWAAVYQPNLNKLWTYPKKQQLFNGFWWFL